MKKLSSISEGWGALVRRDLTDEVRDEDKHPLDEWLKTVHWVDMGQGTLWSQETLPLDDLYGKEFINELVNPKFKEFLERNGLSIPTWEHYGNLVNNSFGKKVDYPDAYIKSRLTGNILEYKNGEYYVVAPFLTSDDGARTLFKVFMWNTSSRLSSVKEDIRWYSKMKGMNVKVRLIKKVQG